MAEITARKSLSGRNVFTMEIKIEKTKTPKAKPVDETKLGFGHIFTDHMFDMEYDTGKCWHDAGNLRGYEGIQNSRRQHSVLPSGRKFQENEHLR